MTTNVKNNFIVIVIRIKAAVVSYIYAVYIINKSENNTRKVKV